MDTRHYVKVSLLKQNLNNKSRNNLDENRNRNERGKSTRKSNLDLWNWVTSFLPQMRPVYKSLLSIFIGSNHKGTCTQNEKKRIQLVVITFHDNHLRIRLVDFKQTHNFENQENLSLKICLKIADTSLIDHTIEIFKNKILIK